MRATEFIFPLQFHFIYIRDSSLGFLRYFYMGEHMCLCICIVFFFCAFVLFSFFGLPHLILFYYYTSDACLFSNESWKGCGPGWEVEQDGEEQRENRNWNILYLKNLFSMKEKGEIINERHLFHFWSESRQKETTLSRHLFHFQFNMQSEKHQSRGWKRYIDSKGLRKWLYGMDNLQQSWLVLMVV